MKTQLTAWYGIILSLTVIMFGSPLWGGISFFDDFSDGDIQDGSPVTWGWNNDITGERLVTSEGLHLNPTAPYAILRDDQGNDVIYTGNITIRMQLRMDSHENWGNTGMRFRATQTGDYYVAGIILNQLYLGRMSNSNWTVLRQTTIPGFSPTEQDIIIQIDVTDVTDATGQPTSRLNVYDWFPGQDKPAQPRISVVDGSLVQGAIVMGIDRCSATFRWVELIAEEPVVDFNGNGTVDIKDLMKMIESWGQENSTVDIVPDSVVDAQDLEVLMDYWQREVNDPTLMANWKLDETEGIFAADSVSETQAIVLGNPVWQPESGQVKGCLAFDGIDDMIIAKPVLNPENSPFSVFAWILGGEPGQAILSQQTGVNWLKVDTDGTLMTELTTSGGRTPGTPLYSGTVITDGNWHRIGLVWDGAQRILYVDDIPVGLDSQDGLDGSTGGLVIGAGTDNQPGSFWSGLIDDVRIYDRVVAP